jgi:hypothetical protein
MKETEQVALLRNFLDEAKSMKDEDLRELIAKLESDFKKIDEPGHVPGEVSNRIIENIKNLRKERIR